MATTWVQVGDALPMPGELVIAFYNNQYGKPRRVRAQYAPRHTLELDPDADGGCGCGDCDREWCTEGWYETNEHEEIHWLIDEYVSHWMPLPPYPTDQPTVPVLTLVETPKLSAERALELANLYGDPRLYEAPPLDAALDREVSTYCRAFAEQQTVIANAARTLRLLLVFDGTEQHDHVLCHDVARSAARWLCGTGQQEAMTGGTEMVNAAMNECASVREIADRVEALPQACHEPGNETCYNAKDVLALLKELRGE